MNRRDFARCALCTMGLPGMGVAVVRSMATAQETLVVDLADPDFQALHQIGGAVKVPVAGEKYPILVVRIDAQHIIAYSSSCTHWDCEVDLPDEDGRVECHCHGSEFDLQGRYVDGPADGDLRRVPVQIVQPTLIRDTSWGSVKRPDSDR